MSFGEFRTVSELFGQLEGLGIGIRSTKQRSSDLAETTTVASVDARDLVEIKQAGNGVRQIGGGSGYQLT